MTRFINDDFLLYNDISKKLYHEYAKDKPILDYHCHINPKEIAENKRYDSITQLWLGGDHYKWRAMRSNGVDEEYITGSADPREKFRMWAYTMEYLVGNPLFHWTQLELARYFDIYEILTRDNCDYIYDKINEMLKDDRFTCRNIIINSNVAGLCTTDDPMDTLEYHKEIAGSDFKVKVLPAFRPDKLIYIERDPYIGYVNNISKEYDEEIAELGMLLEFLEARIEYFHENGCRLSDHSLEPPVYHIYTYKEVAEIFKKKMNGKYLSDDEICKYKTFMMDYLGRQYAKRGWAMQIHIGVKRNLNTNMFGKLGPDTGYDGIDDRIYMPGLVGLLDSLDKDEMLPRTIIYCLNPRDNDMIASIAGAFQKGPVAGKIQFGSAWWFNDTKDGMEKQMTALCGTGLLSRFIGMLTDSRSFLSYTRHEYFRRILCQLLGELAKSGQAPSDIKMLSRMAEDISYENARTYFKGCF